MYALCPKCKEQLLDNGLKEILICPRCGNEIKSRAYDPVFYQKTVDRLKNDFFSEDMEQKQEVQKEPKIYTQIAKPSKNAISFISLAAIICLLLVLTVEVITLIPSCYIVSTEILDESPLFSLDQKNTQYLREGYVNVELRKAFDRNNYTLSSSSKIYKTDDKKWELEDEYKKYIIKETDTQLNIYLEKSKAPFYLPSPTPPFLLIPFTIDGFTLLGCYLFLVFSIIFSIYWIIKKEAKKAYKIFNNSINNLRAPPKKTNNSFVLVPQLFLAIFFFNIAYLVVLILLRINIDEPASLTSYDFWELLFALTRASVTEELVFRLLLIGVPLLLIDYSLKKRKQLKNYFLGGKFEITTTVLLLLIFSSVFFALAHYPGWGIWKVIPVFVAGIAFGYLFLVKGIHTAIILHFIFDYFGTPLQFVDRTDSQLALYMVSGLFFILIALMLIAGLSYLLFYFKSVVNFIKKSTV